MKQRTCKTCKQQYTPTGNNQKHCQECRKIIAEKKTAMRIKSQCQWIIERKELDRWSVDDIPWGG